MRVYLDPHYFTTQFMSKGDNIIKKHWFRAQQLAIRLSAKAKKIKNKNFSLEVQRKEEADTFSCLKLQMYS